MIIFVQNVGKFGALESAMMIEVLADIIFILLVLIILMIAVMHLSPDDYTGDEEEK